MGRVAGLGSWETHEQLIDLLHDEFEKSGITDWVRVAEHGEYWLAYVHDCRALMMAVAGQAAHGALWALADRLGVLREPFVALCDDVTDMPRSEWLSKLFDLQTHGQGQCDDEDCEHCAQPLQPAQVLQ